jgi:hypothetical protein
MEGPYLIQACMRSRQVVEELEGKKRRRSESESSWGSEDSHDDKRSRT